MIKVKRKRNEKSRAESPVKRKRNRNAKVQVATFDKNKLKMDIIHEAKVLGIAESTAEMFSEQVVERVAQWVEKRMAITSDDLNRQLATELKKYSSDLAYVYQNRGKII